MTRSRYFPVLAIIFGAYAPQSALAEDEKLTARIQACAEIRELDKRLACYDGLASDLQLENSNQAGTAAKPNPPSPSAASGNPPPAVDGGTRNGAAVGTGRAEFGLDRPAPGAELRKISVVVLRAQRAHYGEWILETEDGQVWRQSESRRYQIPDLPFEAEIIKRRFGGFYMVSRTFRSGMSVTRER